jgi:hypothetical protein
MKRIATADNLLIATLWHHMLKDAGIRCEIRNQFIGGAVGELPADQVSPQLWLLHDEDQQRAEELLAELRKPSLLPPWFCTSCFEKIEGQFFQCWNCQAVKPLSRR